MALARRARRGREDPARLPEKFGHASLRRPSGPLLWLHALSVGEVLTVLPLTRRLTEARQDLTVLLTTSTLPSVVALGKVGLPARVLHQYAPVDLPAAQRRFLHHWRPDLAVFSEFDLWPVRVLETDAARVPLVLINSRVSAERLGRRQRLAATYGALLHRFRRILLQDEDSRPRFLRLGAPADRIVVTGTLKSAPDPLPDRPEERAALTVALGQRPVWLAAATERREEPAIAAAHAELLQHLPDLLLVHAPRQTRHADEAESAHRARGLSVARRSRGDQLSPSTQVYLADTIGEMGLWYRLCPVAFVGHSLPVAGPPLTGKNPYEAAALGCAVIHGPGTESFSETFAALDAAGGAWPISDGSALPGAVRALLEPAARAPVLAAAEALLANGRAPLEATLRVVLDELAAVRPPLARDVAAT